MKIYYVYQHIIEDTNEPFYIGVSSKTRIRTKYERAYSNKRRNPDWHSIVNLHNYKVEIVFESTRISEAISMEKRLIKKYGRIQLSTGTLVNRSRGGENTFKTKLGYANYRKTK